MAEKNVIAIVCGGVIKQGTLFVDILSKEDFDKTVPTFEKFYSPEYNGWKSPVIKDKTIVEIKEIILKAIEKSNENITEENNSIKEDDDKTKNKKSRFIEGSDNLYNFKITEFKQLLIKELNFKQFSSFNKQEKEIKLKDCETDVIKEIKTDVKNDINVKVKDSSDDEKIVETKTVKKIVIKKKKPEETVDEIVKVSDSDNEKKINTIKKKTIAKNDDSSDDEKVETKKPETKKPETKKPETKKTEIKKTETKKPETKITETKITETKKPEIKKVEVSKTPVKGKKGKNDSASNEVIKVKPIVKTIDSDSDDSLNVAINTGNDSDSNDSD
jgi:hypothetical protein